MHRGAFAWCACGDPVHWQQAPSCAETFSLHGKSPVGPWISLSTTPAVPPSLHPLPPPSLLPARRASRRLAGFDLCCRPLLPAASARTPQACPAVVSAGKVLAVLSCEFYRVVLCRAALCRAVPRSRRCNRTTAGGRQQWCSGAVAGWAACPLACVCVWRANNMLATRRRRCCSATTRGCTLWTRGSRWPHSPPSQPLADRRRHHRKQHLGRCVSVRGWGLRCSRFCWGWPRQAFAARAVGQCTSLARRESVAGPGGSLPVDNHCGRRV